MKYTLLVILALVAAVVFSGQPAWSQAESGTIAGTVVDTTGAVIPGATVVSKSDGCGKDRDVGTHGRVRDTRTSAGVLRH